MNLRDCTCDIANLQVPFSIPAIQGTMPDEFQEESGPEAEPDDPPELVLIFLIFLSEIQRSC